MLISLVATLTGAAFILSQPIRACEKHNKSIKLMEEHQVVPDVIDTLPNHVLEVKYENDEVDLGNILTPTKVKDVPTVKWEADSDTFYTLCMTDPDAPSRKNPTSREFNHWLVGNIKGSDIKNGEVLADYVGSGPPKGTGLHRCVFLLYKQPGKVEFNETHISNRTAEPRRKFSIAKFAKKYNLGSPIAGNFYQAEWDEHSDVIHKSFGFKPKN